LFITLVGLLAVSRSYDQGDFGAHRGAAGVSGGANSAPKPASIADFLAFGVGTGVALKTPTV
jgi:hypothetical protein